MESLNAPFSTPNSLLVFFLADDKGTVLYSFSDLVDNPGWFFSEVQAVSFRDVNKDSLEDIIVIADYITGVGETGAIPFHHSKIYLQKEKEFVCVPELDEKILYYNKQSNDTRLCSGVILFTHTRVCNIRGFLLLSINNTLQLLASIVKL